MFLENVGMEVPILWTPGVKRNQSTTFKVYGICTGLETEYIMNDNSLASDGTIARKDPISG
jgi:hypothetical protein